MKDPSYTPVSRASVTSVAFATLSIVGFVIPVMALFALPACIFGVIAFRYASKYGLLGRKLALVTVPASMTIALGTPFVEIVLFHSEAPPGYARIDFERNLNEHVGQPICIKGYGISESREGVDQFALSPNGSNYRGATIVAVELANGELWDWTGNCIAVSGTLELLPPWDDIDDTPRYILRDAIVRPSRTLYQHRGRETERC